MPSTPIICSPETPMYAHASRRCSAAYCKETHDRFYIVEKSGQKAAYCPVNREFSHNAPKKALGKQLSGGEPK